MAPPPFLGVLILLAASSRLIIAQTNLQPTFLSPLAVFTPNEEQDPGTVIGIVVAEDADRDAIRYYITPGSINVNNFDVNGTTGEVSFERRLDREALAPTNEPLLLYIRATDGIDHGAADPELQVRVFLRDINDNLPQFVNVPRTVTFPENTNEGTTILNVEVSDRDTGANAQLQYQIESIDGSECTDDCMFSIGQSSGVVVLEQSLDYETLRQHTVSILVQDRGNPPNSVVEDLTVAVRDVNDQNPAFLQNDYFAEVHENLTFGDSVIQVRALDQDLGVNDDVVYEIISGNLEIGGQNSFAINNETGIIFVNVNSLDRETYQQYMLTVMASEVNDRTKTDTTRVQITIFDVNDHSPMFAETAYYVNVSESQALQSVLATVVAMDRDFGINADFQFELVNLLNSSMPLPFRIDHNQLSGEGRIVLIEELDYEEQTLYLFNVIATEVVGDSPQNGTTFVSISVINENDNAPIFVNQSYTASIPENAPAGIFVAMLRATDDDFGIFGEVEYSFQDTVSDFNISSANGRVVTAQELDYETQSQYVLSVKASDLHPTLSRQDAVQLTVNLENINDNPPRFVEDQNDVETLNETAPEEVAPPFIVKAFEVLDADGDLNELTFEIVEGNMLGHFEIDGAQLQTTVPLNFDLRTSGTISYSLIVSVNDTEHVDYVEVNVMVLDINDNDPMFDNDTYSFFVQENEDVGFIVGEVFAEDIDSGTYGEIVYSISGPGSENFQINTTTGVIRTAAPLDRELRTDPFNLVVTATDQDENVANRNQVSVPFTVTVLDENDNSPEFGESTYIFEVAENTDFIEFVVSATDSDIGSNRQLRYYIVDGNVEQTFLIGERSGVITRNSSVYLDRERVNAYTLNVSATDEGTPANTASVEVIINILDVNDVIPTFTQTQYNATIREDISANSIVTDELFASDNDDNEFGQVTYSIVSVTAPMDSQLTGSFVIVPSTGVVRTTGAFDREVFSGPYTIMVLGRDGGFPVTNNGTTTLLVYIEDANDNRPIFSPSSYRQSIDEGLAAGQSVTTVSASDSDQRNTPNSQIVFSITDILGFDTTTDVMNHFTIDSASGEIFTNVSLDYETVRSYRITVEASDSGEPQRSSNAFVTVTVLDVNDHAPMLSSDLYEFNIAEDTSVNTRFSSIEATDNDATSNAQITYSIDITGPFSIDPSNGELILTESLDFESTTNYTFTVTATDGGGLSDESIVEVTVLNVNDHQPRFEQDVYTVAIDEGDYSSSAVFLLNVLATDGDSGLLGTVSYAIVPPSGQFSISTLSDGYGQVRAVAYLDRETTDFYRITVVATDGGEGSTSQSATATIEVTVRDVNDITPALDRTEYSVSIRENTIPGDVIAIVQATDEDAGENGQVLFSFVEQPSDFAIDELTGEIRALVSFDYDQQPPNYVYTIQVTDNSTSPLSSTARFVANITDINDNAPVFVSFPADRNLIETASVGQEIARVSATDRDSGDNADIFYQLSNNEGKFTISSTGAITLVNSLDREVTDQYNLTVTAFDRGQPQMSAVSYFVVSVSDVNDVAPSFLSDFYSFLVSEDVPSGSTIGTVFADDGDLGLNGDIVFQLVEGDGTLFQLTTGQSVTGPTGAQRFAGYLAIRRVLDYEMETTYSLLIQAVNPVFPRYQTPVNVSVTVRDTNDNAPRFSMPSGYMLSVSENAPLGTPVGTIVATDIDGGLNGTITYSFGGNMPGTFSINNVTGVLTVNSSLNFETTPEYSFTVVASDNAPPSSRQTTSVSVRVEILDVNELGPVFSQNTYFATVEENLGAGANVVMVNATEGDGGGVEYSIVAGDTSKFTINSDSGLITTKTELDREDINRYVLTVEATDSATSPLSSFAQVEVTVTDVNDNNPEFRQDQYEFNLREHSPVGEALPIVTATDRDLGRNAQLTYSISTGAGEFTVNSETGEITVASPNALDRETTSRINFLLTARDNGTTTRLSDSVPITVVLTNINDFSPVFDSPSYSQSVPENSPAGFSILTVRATDRDGDNVRYFITQGDDSPPNNKFTINAETGLIETTSNVLDRESLVSRDYTYRLFVNGTDDGSTNRSTIVPVTITVTDVNDISPQCPDVPSTFTVAEANTLEVRIGEITATDGDSGTNALVNYQIAAGDILGQFRISTTTGDLFARPGLDFETTPEYNLRIAAFDQAPDPANRRTSTCMVTVTLSDENDNRPVFDLPLYEASVVENATVGHVVTVVRASDDDSGSNGDITYSFQSSVRAFAIDRTSGVITVSGSLDSETVNLYQLDVEAADGGVPRRVGVTQLVIQVVNINDNSPRFDRSFYTEEVSEDTNVDTSIVMITATDPDSPSLTYSIMEGNDEGYFKINAMTGLIETARDLDREQVAVFNLLVRAQDEDLNQGDTRLQVTITDVNDEAPQFLQPAYFARVAENSPRGTQIIPEINMTTIRIEAIDADEPNTQNSRVLYRLAGENSDLFAINFDTGIITVARGTELDHESLPEIVISIVASDSVPVPNTQSSSVELTIQVLDENDNPPVFSERFGYVIPVEEDQQVGTIISNEVQANDPDTGAGGEVRYSISNANPLEALQWFEINRTSGELLLTETLDRESYSNINLMVSGSDQGVPPLSSIVSVQISVGDVNDNAPTFTRSVYTTSVPEFLAAGASAIRVFAVDPDVGSNGEVEFSLLTTTEPFTINPVTGEVTTTSTLDHETQTSHSVMVQACDSGDEVLCNSVSVVINVLDFNDEAPRFDVAEYAVDICHTSLSGQPLVQPVAIDQDSGPNAELTYTLQNERWALAVVNSSTGLISLNRNIDDLDVSIARYEFTIVATDNGDTPLSGSATVVIRVVNCTEQDFIYPSPYLYYEIRENEPRFADGSSTQNLAFTSTVSPTEVAFYPVDFPGNPFLISNNVLSFKDIDDLRPFGLENGLDRELRDLYTMIVRASSMSLTAFTSITVRVLDANDNSPAFQSELYVFDVFENNTETTAVGTVLAEDRDEGSNAEITYLLLGVAPPGQADSFIVNSSTGMISAVEFALDREVFDEYQLSIQASDGSTANSTSVVVNVLDINDCTPTFSQPSYNEEVLENLPAGVVLMSVTASDCDIGSNAAVRYAIVAGDISIFEIDFVSGEITTLVVLDYEAVSSYYLRVRATDMGRPTQLFSEVDVNIEVLDFNDCPPEFIEPPASISFSEDANVGGVIETFSVNDCDGGLNGVNGTRYSIIAGNEEGLFDIIEETGLLYTTATLDRETRSNYLLSIQARDSATVNRLSSVIQLNVIILDENDNDPVFIEPEISITVGEGEEVGEVLVQGQLASDNDAGANGQISYSLLSDEGVFNIDINTGAISLGSSLDRETRDGYALTVVARDRAEEPRSSNATIFVTVRDENDNAPVFLNITSGVTTALVEEDADDGTLVYNVRASDADDGSNAEVTFSLDDPNQPFDISPSGGAITVSGSLDYETRNEYTLVVIATDQGTPQQLSTLARLTVRVTDRNDNPPVFDQSTYAGDQNENTAVGTSILSVLARDNDQTGSSNARVEYSLLRGDVDYFSIDPMSGVISNQIMLDREQQSSFSLTVLANNSFSSTPLTGVAMVTVTVSDVNDEYPQFEEAGYEVTLEESAPSNTLVYDVDAFDNDEDGTPNSDLIYSINVATNQGNLFHINPDSGVITLQNSLDFETRPFFALEVVAEDKGSNPLRNTTIVYVNVTDVNDIVPMFTDSVYTTSINEGVGVFPLELTNLQYTDADSNESFRRSQFEVSSVTTRPPGVLVDEDLFSVTRTNNFTGAILLNNELDYEQITSYTIEVSVINDEDLATYLCQEPVQIPCRLSSTATLNVIVTDINDNTPEFIEESYSGEVSTSAPPDTSILTVSARDDDRSVQFSTVKYRLDDEALREGKFRIDENTGTLFTRSGFEEDVGFSYTLNVIAFDNDGQEGSRQDEATVTLVVLDNFQRVAIVFETVLSTIVNKQDFIVQLLENITNYDVIVEQYASYSNETHTRFIFHAIDSNNNIIDFNEFLQRVGNQYTFIFDRLRDCNITTIMSFATPTVYAVPPLLDRETIVILVFCLLLILGAVALLAMALRQRFVAWSQEKLKEGALATNHLFGPGGLEHGHYQTDAGVEEQYELMQKGNFLNPMYVVPVSDPTADLETSVAGSTTGLSSMHRNNPLYESQEISMDMFKEPDYDDEDEDDLDDDGTDALAAALDEEDEGEEDGGIHNIDDDDSDEDVERTMI